MKDEPRSPATKHQLQHAVPTVIHNPEEDLPLLARWLRRAMENPTRFWSLIGAVVLVVVGLAVLGSGVSLGRIQTDEAWTELELAKTPGDRVELAKKFPKTPASQSALLQAATEYFNQGFNDLPSNRDAAGPQLKKAADLFQQVADESPKESPLARAAALGLARALEAQNQIEKAIKQYELVAETWPETDAAKDARAQAEELKKPESQEFYKELYAFKPFTATLPPSGETNFPFALPPGHPAVGSTPDSDATTPPFLLPPLVPGTTDSAAKGKDEMPAPILLPPAPTKAKAETDKAASPPTNSKGELPADVFSPGSGKLPADVFSPGKSKP